jgi:hypothetical protein
MSSREAQSGQAASLHCAHDLRKSSFLVARVSLLAIAGTLLLAAHPAGAADNALPPLAHLTASDAQARVETENAQLDIAEGRPIPQESPAARVAFGIAEWPQVIVRATARPWDLSGAEMLVVPVENPESVPVDLVIRVDEERRTLDGPPSRAGGARIMPHQVTALILPLQELDSMSMGMVASPLPDPPALDEPPTVIAGARGMIDRSRVGAIRLIVPHPATPRTLILGDPFLIAGREPGRSAYDGIVDAFGQYTRAAWPEKVASVGDIRARGQQEAGDLDAWQSDLPKMDRFDGLLDIPAFRATGFFRTERRDGRWFLVTPEGHGFFSLGVDVVRPDTGATYVTGRKSMFESLPELGNPLAVHYGNDDPGATRPGQAGRRFDKGRSFDFYAANLERKYGRDYAESWERTTVARLRGWGFNTIGNWSDPHLISRGAMPFVVPVSPSGRFAHLGSGGSDWWTPMPDPFDPKFVAALDAAMAEAAKHYRDDPFLIGYFVDNELHWTFDKPRDNKRRYGLAIATLSLGPESPANQAFLHLLAQNHGGVAAAASAWDLTGGRRDALGRSGFALSAEDLQKPAVIADLEAFTTLFAETYYRTVAESIHRHDPNHLYLGSRFQWRTQEAVAACARYCDVVSFNIYEDAIGNEAAADEWNSFHALGKPALVGEFHFGSADRGLFWPGLFNVTTEAQRGAAYGLYLDSVRSNPDFVGAHWFMYGDEPLTGRVLDGENGHVGFVSVADVPYRDLAEAAREANLALLRALQ